MKSHGGLTDGIGAIRMNFQQLCASIRHDGSANRYLLGLVGAPASGKSTLAAAMARTLPDTLVLPMDGFHLDDRILDARGHRHRKGAPHTFDVAGLATLLRRVRIEPQLYAPAFDRSIEIARAAAIEIGPDTRVLIVEGNWLLHDRDGWDGIRPLLDACWALELPISVLERRLIDRWRRHRIPAAQARAKIELNDLPNARLAADTFSRADRIIDGLSITGGAVDSAVRSESDC
ncbi:MAG: nucleoside/nucleotide kinase family protein [Pseudomonadota bacterium]